MDRTTEQAFKVVTERGMALDRERAAAHRELRAAIAAETDRRAWRAATAVTAEHRTLCARIVASLDDLISALEAEQALHRSLIEQAGASRLMDLRADLGSLHRLRRSAAMISEKSGVDSTISDPSRTTA